MFPGLVRRPGSALWSEATGVPVDGNNTFALGLDPLTIQEDWLQITVDALGSSVLHAEYVGLSADRTQITINFSQAGTDPARVIVQNTHTVIR